MGADPSRAPPVKIQLSDPELVDGLLSFLERMGVEVAPSRVETVIELPDDRGAPEGRGELERYLALWGAKHPNAGAALID
jgi:hypothetical protein